jgi:hypothetical protein
MDKQNPELSNDAATAVVEAQTGQISDDQLDQVTGGVGNVIASTYKKGDGNGEAAFYAGVCMGLMGL